MFLLPTNVVLAYISNRFDDRELILGALVMMFVGILGFLLYSEDGDEYSETRFILFGLVPFVSCNAGGTSYGIGFTSLNDVD